MLVAFVLNRIYVFPFAEGSLHQQMAWFVLINVGAFPVVWAVAFVLGELVFSVWMPRQFALGIGHAIAICLPALINFALHKLITFRGA
jgi:putative flippase GtrA